MKKALSMLLAASMALGLMACSSNAGGNASSQATSAPAEASSEAAGDASSEETVEEEALEGTITIWHSYTRGQQDFITQAVADFNAANPGITVVEEFQESGSFTDNLYMAVMAGNGPDIVIHYASEAAKYVADDKVADLTPYLSSETLARLDAAPAAIKAEATSFMDGKLHILPLVSSGPVLFYNKEVYDELGLNAPETWDELIANCEAVQAAYPEMAGFAFDSEVDGASALIMQTGNKGFDADGIYFNTDEVAEQMQFYQDNIANGNFTNVKDDYFSSRFNQRTLAAYVGSVAGVPYIGPDNDGPEFGIGIVPQTEGGTKWTPAWNRGIIVFNYEDENRVKIAAKFADYFASPEVNAGFCVACNYPAIYDDTKAVSTYADYLSTPNLGWEYLHTEYAGAFPAVTAYAYARTALGTLMKEVASGVDVHEALNTAVEYIEDELASE